MKVHDFLWNKKEASPTNKNDVLARKCDHGWINVKMIFLIKDNPVLIDQVMAFQRKCCWTYHVVAGPLGKSGYWRGNC